MNYNGTVWLARKAYSLVVPDVDGWRLSGLVAVGVVSVLWVAYLWLQHRWNTSFDRMRDLTCPLPLPPGTMGCPFVGETLEFVRKGAEFFAARMARHGPVYKTHIIGSPVVRVVGGEHVRHVLAGEHVNVRSNWPLCVQRLVGPQSLLGMSSEQHRKVKPVIGAIFNPTVLSSFVPTIQRVVDRHLDGWCQTSAAQGQVLGFPACQRLSLDLALEIVLGQSVERSQDDSLPQAMRDFVGNLFSLPVSVPGSGMWKGMRARERILQEVRHKLDTTQERSDADFHSLVELMQLQADMTDRRQLIEDNSLELFFAGYTTTSSALCSILMCMGRNPEVLQKVEAELEEEGLLQDLGKELTYDVIERLHYVHSCNSEVLRFYPPVGAFYRKAIRTLQIGGFQVPRDWVVACSIRETQQASGFFQDPDRFLPERWLQVDEERREALRYDYLPYGTGARVCVGRRLAVLFQAVLLAQVVRRCRYRLKNPQPAVQYIPVTKPRDDLPMVFTYRSREEEGEEEDSEQSGSC